MLATLTNKLRWSYRKNAPDLFAILTRNYPDFVTARNPAPLREEIPVFTFHTVEPVAFEAQLQYLKHNGYRTLSGTEFQTAMSGEIAIPPKSVVLTFDDGRASLWSVAFPLLQKYGFCAISFIIPGLIPEYATLAKTYEDYIAGEATTEDLLSRERSVEPLCSWEEIYAMHESGVIDFQSHTMYHHQVCVSPQVVDFMHPNFAKYFFGNINVPVYRENGELNYARELPLGAPIYRSEPRLAGRLAYWDDEKLRQACVDYVQQEGGERFFQQENWRKRLAAFHQTESKRAKQARLEKAPEQHRALLEDLTESKRIIEEMLPNKVVEQFCFPWFMGSPLAVRLSKEAGYKVNYWGIVPSRPTNRSRQSLYYVPRVEDFYIYRLPGEGRQRLRDLLKTKVQSYFPGFAAQFVVAPSGTESSRKKVLNEI